MGTGPRDPLDYATPQRDHTRPKVAAVVGGVLLLIIGGLFFFVGIGAIGLGLKAGQFPEATAIAFAAVGAFVCSVGMKLNRARRRAG